MSIATSASLYQERTGQVAAIEVIDHCLNDLAQAKDRWRTTPLTKHIELAQACLDGVIAATDRWVAKACRAKGIELDSPLEGEEMAAGPLATVRYLTLLIRSLSDIEPQGTFVCQGKSARPSTVSCVCRFSPLAACTTRCCSPASERTYGCSQA